MLRIIVFLAVLQVFAIASPMVKREKELVIGEPTSASTTHHPEKEEKTTASTTTTTTTATTTTEETTTEATTTETTTTEATVEGNSFERTVIFLKKSTRYGQEVFIRGGVGGGAGCTQDSDPENDPCAIPIEHLDLELNAATPSRDRYAIGDNYLSWANGENTQTSEAKGSPAQWTTSKQGDDYQSELNKYGKDYWMVEVDMDCSGLEDGLFEFKGIMNNGKWENDIPSSNCDGDGAQSAGFYSRNHVGRCGYINVFEWGSPRCSIISF